MIYKKYQMFFFCAVLVLSGFFFLRDAYCLGADVKGDGETGPSRLHRKKGSTFRSQSKSAFLENLTEARANLKRTMGEKSEEITALWSTAFKNAEHFDEILNHLIARDLKSPRCSITKVIKHLKAKDRIIFKFLYREKESEDLKEKVLIRIIFLNQSSIPVKFKEKEKKNSSENEIFSFSSFLENTQNNPTDDLVLKMLWNALDAVFLNTPSKLSSFSSTKKAGVRKLLILNGDMEDRKGIMVEYYTNVLNPKSFEEEALKEAEIDEFGQGYLQDSKLPRDTEYMENGDSSDEEEAGAGSAESEKKESALDDEYMWTGSNFEDA